MHRVSFGNFLFEEPSTYMSVLGDMMISLQYALQKELFVNQIDTKSFKLSLKCNISNAACMQVQPLSNQCMNVHKSRWKSARCSLLDTNKMFISLLLCTVKLCLIARRFENYVLLPSSSVEEIWEELNILLSLDLSSTIF